MKQTKILTIFFVFSLLITLSSANAEVYSYSFEFNINDVQIGYDQYGDILRYQDYELEGQPGYPFMPAKTGHLSASFGADVIDIRIVSENWITFGEGYDIRPAPTPIPISYTGPQPEVVRNVVCYASEQHYPQQPLEFTGGGKMRGYSFGGFKIHPLRFFPASGRVDILTGLTIEVVSGVSNTSFNPTSEFASVVSRFVDNPDLVHKQPVPLSPTDPNDVKYLIITSSSLESSFQPLADWYTKTGFPSEIITLTAIQSGYSGSTDQLKIKSCVEDYATNKGTIFVLLGGDDTIIPDQNCWGDVNSGGTTDNTIPTDLFYACHDNTFDWNLDSDSQVGEYSVDGIDLYPEVFISRAPVRSTTDVNNFVNKTLNYIQNQPSSNFTEPMLISGVELWNTWSGRSDADWRGEKLWDDYITPNWSSHSRLRFYDTNTDFGGASHEVTQSNLISKFNSGYNYFFMATHGNQTIWGMEDGYYFFSSDAAALTNSSEQGVIYTIACITNAFDLEVYASDPCLSEGFIRNGSGGAVAYQGCSRYGWGWSNQSDNHGPSFQYADAFYTFLFTGTTSGVPTGYPYRLGAVAASHKAYNVPSCSNGAMLWLNYGLNSIGDPGMDLYTENPSSMSLTYDSSMPTGSSSYNVSGLPTDARVCLWKGSEVYEVDTESSGEVTISIDPSTAGYMYLTASAHNYLPVIDSVQVLDSGANVIYDSYTIDDSAGGGDDGYVNSGESIILGVQLENTGPDTALNVTALLTTTDSYATITDSTHSYPDIAGNNGTQNQLDAFAFDVAGNTPDGHDIDFTLTVTGTNFDTSTNNFTITVYVLGTIDDDNSSIMPTEYGLIQNYPNPFNSTTAINYSIPEGSMVNLEIFNLLGQKIISLVNTKQSAGDYSVSWDASDYSSGTYFYKLTADNYSEVRRMTILK